MLLDICILIQYLLTQNLHYHEIYIRTKYEDCLILDVLNILILLKLP